MQNVEDVAAAVTSTNEDVWEGELESGTVNLGIADCGDHLLLPHCFNIHRITPFPRIVARLQIVNRRFFMFAAFNHEEVFVMLKTHGSISTEAAGLRRAVQDSFTSIRADLVTKKLQPIVFDNESTDPGIPSCCPQQKQAVGRDEFQSADIVSNLS